MDYTTGKVSFILLLGVVFAWIVAWVLARRYRLAMRVLMSGKFAAAEEVAASAAGTVSAPHADRQRPLRRVTAADNRRAGWRLTALLVGVSALMASSAAALRLHVTMAELEFLWGRLFVLALAHLWPVIPALALMWRWSRIQLLGAMALWFALCFGVLLWRSIVPNPIETFHFLSWEIGPGLLIVLAVVMGGATRAIAPWVLLPLTGLAWASMSGLDLIEQLAKDPPGWFLALTGALGAESTMGLFAVAPWLVAWWPFKWLGRRLAQAYTGKWLSDLLVLFTATWAIALGVDAITAAGSVGLDALAMLAPLAWVPLVMGPLRDRRVQPAADRPPTLLVLRVFQHDARIQRLFDDVIERWRLTGNTVLIAGTDLVERTLDAGDIFDFVDGRLAERFILRPQDLATRLAAFDLLPDAEGRHRINECYCHDLTWQQALAALVDRSDVVLMDLRSFKAHNEGCKHELGVLARAGRLARVVVLTDGDTDREAAQAAMRGAPAGRFVWVDTKRLGRATWREVLARLFVAGDGAAA